MDLRVIPLHAGTMTVNRANMLPGTYGTLKIPCLMWYITGTREHIIVDTGPAADPAWGTAHHNSMDRPDAQQISSLLHSLGIVPAQVQLVINTHLHWDHCYGNPLFPNARFLVQREELRYAIAPDPKDRVYYEHDLRVPPFLDTYSRYEWVEGDAQVASGVAVLHTPGHTPGMQAVLVETRSGLVCIAGDTLPLYENAAADPPICSSIFTSRADWERSAHRLLQLGGVLLPGHDMRVLNHKEYPV